MTNLAFFGPGFRDLDREFSRLFVGFDDRLNRIVQTGSELAKSLQNYPPCNVIKVDDSRYQIEIAVSGFSEKDIDVELKDGRLVVNGAIKEDKKEDKKDYLHRGIAARAFTRSFVLDDEVEVRGAELVNGMLTIGLERVIPEHRRPKKIPIIGQSSSPQLLTE